jgi:hypothetical protein
VSPAARTVQIWGLYALGVGLVLLLVPNVLLDVLRIPTTDEPWIRIMGVLALAIGVYYLGGARTGAPVFFRATVAGRVVVAVGIVVLAVVWGYWAAILFAVAEVISALWTWTALRSEEPAPTPSAATG